MTDIVEAIARVLYECEKKRAESARNILTGGNATGCEGILMEPYEECADVFRSDARAVVAAHNKDINPICVCSDGGRPDVQRMHCVRCGKLWPTEANQRDGSFQKELAAAHNAQCEAEPAAPDEPKAPPTQRVFDFNKLRFKSVAEIAGHSRMAGSPFADDLARDWADMHAALAGAQTALAAKDARIAELEEERIVDKSLRLPDALPFYVTQESYDGLAAQVDKQCKFLSRLMQRLPIPDDLPSLEDVANWIADRLEAQLQAARAAGSREEGQSSAATDVLAERRRQIDAEGWTPEHDDEHDKGELARAAACYAFASSHAGLRLVDYWPWSPSWWKTTNPRRDLVKAGALILAEIERLDRARLTAPAEPTADTGEKR